MATKTPNISLNKPEYSDHVKIARYNENMDILDRIIKNHEDRITTLEGEVDDLQKRMTQAEEDIDALETEIKNIKTEIANIKNDITNINNTIAEMGEKTNDLTTRVEKLESRVTAIENSMVKEIVFHGETFTPTNGTINLKDWSTCEYYITDRGAYLVAEISEDDRHIRHRTVEGKMYKVDYEESGSTYGHIDFVGMYLGMGWFWGDGTDIDNRVRTMISVPFEITDDKNAPDSAYNSSASVTYWFNEPSGGISFKRRSINNNPEFENHTGQDIQFKVDYYYDKRRTNPDTTTTNDANNISLLSDSTTVTVNSKDELIAKIKIGMGLQVTDPTPDILMYWTNEDGDIIAQDGTVIKLTNDEKETVSGGSATNYGELS